MANNGAEVLQALEQKAYDIVLLDVQMPEMDGLEAARKNLRTLDARQAPVHHCHDGQRPDGGPGKMPGRRAWTIIFQSPCALWSCRARWSGGADAVPKPDTSFLVRPPKMSSQSVLDESILEELRDISPNEGSNIVRELINLFLESAPQRIAQINECLSDPPGLAFHAHALRSMGLNLGAKRIVDLSQQLEELGRSGDLSGAPALLRELEAAFNQTRLQLLPMRKG